MTPAWIIIVSLRNRVRPLAWNIGKPMPMPDGANDRKEVGTEGEAVPQPRVDIPWSGLRGRIDRSRLAPSIRRNDRRTHRIALYILSRQILHPTRQGRYLPVGLSEDMRRLQIGPDHKGPLWVPSVACKAMRGTSIPSRCLTAPSSWGTNSILSFLGLSSAISALKVTIGPKATVSVPAHHNTE